MSYQNGILGETLPHIAKNLERIANILEQSVHQHPLKNVQEIVQEEIKAIHNVKTPEESFVEKVAKLNSAFKELVNSFSKGEANNIHYMKNYPFKDFSIVELAIAVNQWEKSVQEEYKKWIEKNNES
jgi:5'-deoxynucleotidase YfbR-like HD superfamily hydrolase